MGHDGLLETHGPMTGESGNINAPDAAMSPVEGMSRNDVSSAQRFLLTVAGRRRRCALSLRLTLTTFGSVLASRFNVRIGIPKLHHGPHPGAGL